jgi:beta-N-acetylhexosaminidase
VNKIPKKKLVRGLFFFLIVVNLLLLVLTVAKARGLLIPEQPEIIVEEGVIDLDDFTLKQKIAQMTVVLGIQYYSDSLKNMQLGGIHLHAMINEEAFKRTVREFQREMNIPFMVTADLEGCVNPFSFFKQFTSASDIETLGEAFEKGKIEGRYLKELGVTIDFAPVVDLDDKIWGCRSFPGDKEMISELANAYILGMHDEGILATAKHYPGKTLVVKDPHKYLVSAEITEEDIYPYKELVNKGTVEAIMVSHLITFGEVNSEGKPSVASKKIIEGLREMGFDGLIITDEINMQGARKFYDTIEEMYVDVFKAGSDIVLNFNNDPNEIYHMIETIELAISNGEIEEEKIDNSVRKILEFKGFKVKG